MTKSYTTIRRFPFELVGVADVAELSRSNKFIIRFARVILGYILKTEEIHCNFWDEKFSTHVIPAQEVKARSFDSLT